MMLGGHYFAEGDLLEGEGCSTAALPEWEHDATAGNARLPDGAAVELELVPGWEATLERPTLLVLRGNGNPGGVIPTIELFVAARCASVRQQRTMARLAARALEELEPPERLFAKLVEPGAIPTTTNQNGGAATLTLQTMGGKREIAVHFAELVRSESFVVLAAAACPRPADAATAEGDCDAAYRALLATAPPADVTK